MRKLSHEEYMNIIDCIGADSFRHSMISWENNCLCGQSVRHKRTISDSGTPNYKFDCFECDSVVISYEDR